MGEPWMERKGKSREPVQLKEGKGALNLSQDGSQNTKTQKEK